MTRRQAMVAVMAVAAQIHGKQAAYAQSGAQTIRLVLDGMAGIVVQYRGQTVTITPQELMNVLRQK